jgi:(p)ppGpp synthase/HD superfamily hydrolase
VNTIISRAQAYMQEMTEQEVKSSILEAYEFSKYAHRKHIRLSGEPYIAHPVAATEILLSLNPDIYTLQACLLHDVIEDTEYSYNNILEKF